MDIYNTVLAMTLATVGLFLVRDYVQFLRGSYAMHGRVTSIQQVFRVQLEGEEDPKHFVKNGFYPVIQYKLKDKPVCFTAIDQNLSGRFHVGDEVKIRVTKSRRSETRTCKIVSSLVIMLVALCLGLVADAFIDDFKLPVANVVFASAVITFCLAVLAVYMRDKDEYYLQDLRQTKGGRTQLCLFEPTAFTKWHRARRDPAQAYKIRSSQFFGASCFCVAMLVLVTTFDAFAVSTQFLP